MTEGIVQPRLPMREAFARFRNAQGLPPRYHEVRAWTVALGPVVLRLPNFRWRRRAIVAHDLHHLITGHPCTLRGECLVAAWEFGAGRFPHPAATAFCLPLVLMGTAVAPVETWRSFRAGRGTRSLHGEPLASWVWESSLEELRRRLKKETRKGWKDALAFAATLAWATGIILLPALAAGVLTAALF